MTWEERLLFLMFLDYKGVLEKWEENHNKCTSGYNKIEHASFFEYQGFCWSSSKEGHDFWHEIAREWQDKDTLYVDSLGHGLKCKLYKKQLEIGCQSVTKKDALKIADFIYECFGEEV